jgi:hypothetical protein
MSANKGRKIEIKGKNRGGEEFHKNDRIGTTRKGKI